MITFQGVQYKLMLFYIPITYVVNNTEYCCSLLQVELLRVTYSLSVQLYVVVNYMYFYILILLLTIAGLKGTRRVQWPSSIIYIIYVIYFLKFG